MTDRKELKRQFSEAKKHAGVFLITNNETGRVYLGSSTNFHGPLNAHRFMLRIGSHQNAALQADFRRLGEEAFSFEIVESFERKDDDPAFSLDDELTLLEEIWLEKLQPFAARVYNTNRNIRQ
jgi:group I intron endonuclease